MRYSRRFLWTSLMICAALIPFFLWAWIAYPTRNTAPVGIPFALWGLIETWRAIRDGGVVLRLSPAGFHYRHYSRDTIPWSVINKVETGFPAGQFFDADLEPMLVVHLKDAVTYPPRGIRRLLWFPPRRAMEMGFRSYAWGIKVRRFGFTWDFDEVADRIAAFHSAGNRFGLSPVSGGKPA